MPHLKETLLHAFVWYQSYSWLWCARFTIFLLFISILSLDDYGFLHILIHFNCMVVCVIWHLCSVVITNLKWLLGSDKYSWDMLKVKSNLIWSPISPNNRSVKKPSQNSFQGVIPKPKVFSSDLSTAKKKAIRPIIKPNPNTESTLEMEASYRNKITSSGWWKAFYPN